MILYLLFFYLLGESMATEVTNTPVSGDISKSVMCYLGGDLKSFNPELVNIESCEIPCECEVYRPFNENVGKYIIPYVKQLKFTPDFIIGIAVDAMPSSIKNPCMYNFAELNDLVTFYEIQTFALNACKPNLYNGMTPITQVNHGVNYVLGMEEVVSFLKESKISLTKMTFDIEVVPIDADTSTVLAYTQVCKGDYNCSSSCIQTTNNLYEKGKFACDQNSGVVIKYLDLDDVKNDCGCSTAFIGLMNIIAGYRGGSQISCAKYDVQPSQFAIQ